MKECPDSILKGNTAENGVYILAEEITGGVPDTNSNNAGPSSRHMRTVHDLADEYQLAGPTGDQYANFESVLRFGFFTIFPLPKYSENIC